MATILPFDNAIIDGKNIDEAQFVTGSGSYTTKGFDRSVTTADGIIRRSRSIISREASFEVYGNMSSEFNSPAGIGQSCTLQYDSNTIATFDGIVTAIYKSASAKTYISIKA